MHAKRAASIGGNKIGNPTYDQFALEGDGLLENFFHLLWTKQDFTGKSPNVAVPDTVIIRYNQPVAWYFMWDGVLRKKQSERTTYELIREKFLRKIPPCGIVATFMQKDLTSDQPKTVFEYLDKDKFEEFFSNMDIMRTGVLQKFVQPHGEHNSIIRVIWSPCLTMFEKRENINQINNSKVDIYERAATYEASEFHTKTTSLKGYILTNTLRELCQDIRQHILRISSNNLALARLILNFKFGTNEKLWLLFCSSVRFEDGNYTSQHGEFVDNFSKNFRSPKIDTVYQPPSFVNLRLQSTKEKKLVLSKIIQCKSCQQEIDPQSAYEVKYQTLIEGYEHSISTLKRKDIPIIYVDSKKAEEARLTEFNISPFGRIVQGMEPQVNRNNKIIPPIILAENPLLKDTQYLELKKDQAFLNKLVTLCENCNIEALKGQEAFLKGDRAQGEFVGCGILRPELLNERRVRTRQAIESKKRAEELVERDLVQQFREKMRKEAAGSDNATKSTPMLRSRKTSWNGYLRRENLAAPQADELQVGEDGLLQVPGDQSLSHSTVGEPIPSLNAILSGELQVNDISLKANTVFKYTHHSKMLEKETHIIQEREKEKKMRKRKATNLIEIVSTPLNRQKSSGHRLFSPYKTQLASTNFQGFDGALKTQLLQNYDTNLKSKFRITKVPSRGGSVPTVTPSHTLRASVLSLEAMMQRPITSQETLQRIPKAKYLSLYSEYKAEAKGAIPDEFDWFLNRSKKFSAASTMFSWHGTTTENLTGRQPTPLSMLSGGEPLSSHQHEFKGLFAHM